MFVRGYFSCVYLRSRSPYPQKKPTPLRSRPRLRRAQTAGAGVQAAWQTAARTEPCHPPLAWEPARRFAARVPPNRGARAQHVRRRVPRQARHTGALIPIAEPEFITPPSCRFPPLREGNQAARPSVPPASRGNLTGVRLGSPREAGGTCRRGEL